MSKDSKSGKAKGISKQEKKLLKRIAKLEDRVELLEYDLESEIIVHDEDIDALVEAMGRVLALSAVGTTPVGKQALYDRFGPDAPERDLTAELEEVIEQYYDPEDTTDPEELEARIDLIEHEQRVSDLEFALLDATVDAVELAEREDGQDDDEDEDAEDGQALTSEPEDDDNKDPGEDKGEDEDQVKASVAKNVKD